MIIDPVASTQAKCSKEQTSNSLSFFKHSTYSFQIGKQRLVQILRSAAYLTKFERRSKMRGRIGATGL